MELENMRIRAAIFDVYGTLLDVGPPPSQAEEEWRTLWIRLLHCEPRLTRLGFSIACSRIINREHETARCRGIATPEVIWPVVVAEAVPETRALDPNAHEEFILGQIRTGHTTRMPQEAAEVLRKLKEKGCLLGIASNAQAYTLRELEDGLRGHGLGLNAFEPDLCFWSYQHGFSKPDPHVFQSLSARLELRGILRDQTGMIGDRLDNDIEPARLHGWQAWHLSHPGQSGSGGWPEFLASFA